MVYRPRFVRVSPIRRREEQGDVFLKIRPLLLAPLSVGSKRSWSNVLVSRKIQLRCKSFQSARAASKSIPRSRTAASSTPEDLPGIFCIHFRSALRKRQGNEQQRKVRTEKMSRKRHADFDSQYESK